MDIDRPDLWTPEERENFAHQWNAAIPKLDKNAPKFGPIMFYGTAGEEVLHQPILIKKPHGLTDKQLDEISEGLKNSNSLMLLHSKTSTESKGIDFLDMDEVDFKKNPFLQEEFIKRNRNIPNNMCENHFDNNGLIKENGICDICNRKYKKSL